MKLILVVGPPRSGTSFVARILSEYFNVCMGHQLVPGNHGNPLGFFEDSAMVQETTEFKSAKSWKSRVKEVHPECQLIGVKTPELAFTPIGRLGATHIVRTTRLPSDAALSLAKWHQPTVTLEKARCIVDMYEIELDRKLVHIPHITINTTRKLTEKEVAKRLDWYIGS